jgi:hypothetical protein
MQNRILSPMRSYAEDWAVFSSRPADSPHLIALNARAISKNLFYVFHILLF